MRTLACSVKPSRYSVLAGMALTDAIDSVDVIAWRPRANGTATSRSTRGRRTEREALEEHGKEPGMPLRLTLLVLFSLIGASCDRTSPLAGPAPGVASGVGAPRESLGNVMAEVARRFELAGRAANANRFELAEFEAGEIAELFETDVPNAELPKEGPTAHIPAMAKSFLL